MDVFFDIETIPLPLEQRQFGKPTDADMKYGNTKDPIKRQTKLDTAIADWEEGSKCALSAATGRVALIGYAIDGYMPDGKDEKENTDIIIIEDEDESKMINEFFELLQGLHPMHDNIVGHYSNNFDIPFLFRRAFINHLHMPELVLGELGMRSDKRKLLKDTMDLWGFGEYNASISLASMCGALGIPVKTGDVTGKDFYKFWADHETMQDCRDYLREDVNAVRQIFRHSNYTAKSDAPF